MKRSICVALSLILALMSLAACGGPSAEDLMENITPDPEVKNNIEISDVSDAAVCDFAVRLFKASEKNGENTLISPLSVLAALSMTANGADNETLAQMESVLGMPTEQLNAWMSEYMQNLPQGKDYKLSLANSIWFKDADHFSVNEEFLQTNADYYGAGVYKAPFDGSTLKEINKWVEDNTDGMIKDILDEIPYDAVMYLVNALAFDALWDETYEDYHIRDGRFTREDGVRQDVEFMYSSENMYLEDDMAKGFIKYYKDREYAFVALLPNEGVTVSEYVASLDGNKLHEMLKNAQYNVVSTSIPKFETEYDVEMKDILSSMGMPDAFNSKLADFSKLGTSTKGNIFINRVIHKTYIAVDQSGTRAGAATVVEMTGESAMEPLEPPKEVYLDRPFVYMLIDCETKLPFFIGTMMDVDGADAPQKEASLKDSFVKKAEDIEKYSKEHLETALTQLDINTESHNVCVKWDSLMNEVYEYLKDTMDSDDFTYLSGEQEGWIKEREYAVAAEGELFKGGSGEAMARNMVAIEYTSERCYYLISLVE